MTVTDRLAGARSSLGYKAPCKVATTANITLSGEQTIDDVAVTVDDRVLVKDQTDASQNGIYEVRAGAWVRAADFAHSRDVTQGTRVNVVQGTVGQGEYEVTTSGTIVIGTTNITIAYWSLGSAAFSSLAVGTDDSVPGAVSIYGGGATEDGARIDIHNAADHDTNTEFFRIGPNANGDLKIGRGGNDDVVIQENGGGVLLSQVSGTVTIGTDDSVRAVVSLYGDSTGNGAVLDLFNGAASDGTAGYYRMSCSTDGNLTISRDAGAADITLTSTGGILFTTLPSSNPGVAGQIYSNSNVLTVSTG